MGHYRTRRQCLGALASLGLGPLAGQARAAVPAPAAAASAAAPAGAEFQLPELPPTPLTLKVAAYPSVDKIIEAALPQFRARYPQVTVQIVSRQFADHHTAMTTALSTAIGLPDVMALEVGYLGRFAQGGGLDDLSQPPYDALRHRARFVPYAWAQATNRRGAVVALPTDIGPGTLLYRADILAKAGLDEAALTGSWDSFVAAGAQIKARTGAYLLATARDIKDILIRTGIGPGDGLYYGAQSQVLVNSPRFERAFRLARSVRQQKLDAKVAAWSSDWNEGFKRGTIATQLTGAWLAGHLNGWLAPNTTGQWRAAQLPEGAFAAYGGTFYAVPRLAKAALKPAAWAFIQLMTLSRQAQLSAFKAQDAFPALLEALDDPFFEQPIAFLGGQRARLGWREAARRIQAVSVHKQDAFAGEVIDTALDQVLLRGQDIATALGEAERLLRQRALR